MSDEIKEVKTKLNTLKKADLVKLCEELIEKKTKSYARKQETN